MSKPLRPIEDGEGFQIHTDQGLLFARVLKVGSVMTLDVIGLREREEPKKPDIDQ